MRIKLAYDRHGLIVELPDSVDVVEPRFIPALSDEAAALQHALHNPIHSAPLAELLKSGSNVVIVHTDITRATPNNRILPVLLDELMEAGIKRTDITLLNGLGTHRQQTETELREMLGDSIVDNFRCLQHNCFDDESLISLGETSMGHPVRINRHYLEADVRILTGFIEPHFFAGFSGGPKAILPSLAGAESVFTNHGIKMIAHPKATWGITEGNPMWEEMCEVALLTNPTFLFNVTLNTNQEITGVFAGDITDAHAEGCDFVKESAMVEVDEPYDIVITTNSGYPLDQNLYQSVKGMSAASKIVREGGSIIIATGCEDGLPEHGRYADLLVQAGSPQGVLEMISKPGFSVQDQWQVQIQAQIQLKAEVYVYSDGISKSQIEQSLFSPCDSIEQTVAEIQEKYPSKPRICVIPEGPMTIPYLSN